MEIDYNILIEKKKISYCDFLQRIMGKFCLKNFLLRIKCFTYSIQFFLQWITTSCQWEQHPPSLNRCLTGQGPEYKATKQGTHSFTDRTIYKRHYTKVFCFPQNLKYFYFGTYFWCTVLQIYFIGNWRKPTPSIIPILYLPYS